MASHDVASIFWQALHAGTPGALPTSPGQAGAMGAPAPRAYFDDAAPFASASQDFGGMFEASAEAGGVFRTSTRLTLNLLFFFLLRILRARV